MHRGYIKFWRCCQDNSLYFEDKFSRWQAWQDLILLANWEDGVYLKRSVKFEVKRGMLAWSTKGLADRWGWSRSKVDRFLKYLENEHQIEHQKNTITTLITIINYDKYQEKDNKTNIKRTSNEHQTNTSKESKALKESKEVKIKGNGFYPEWLDKELWREFKKMRVAIKKPLTEFAEKKSITKLKTIIDKGFSQEDVVSIAIEKCWQTFYEPHEKLMQKDDESAFDKELSAIRKQRELANEKKTALSK